jgi:hypothetical protein
MGFGIMWCYARVVSIAFFLVWGGGGLNLASYYCCFFGLWSD